METPKIVEGICDGPYQIGDGSSKDVSSPTLNCICIRRDRFADRIGPVGVAIGLDAVRLCKPVNVVNQECVFAELIDSDETLFRSSGEGWYTNKTNGEIFWSRSHKC